MIEIPLYGGGRGKRLYVVAYARVSNRDAWVAEFHWHLTAQGYAARRRRMDEGPRELVLMHREIVGLKKGNPMQVDHRDRNKLNNQRRNLRVLTHGQQAHNMLRQGNFTSEYRGVAWDKKTSKWIAYCHVEGKKHVAGYFTNERLAGLAARNLRKELLSHALD